VANGQAHRVVRRALALNNLVSYRAHTLENVVLLIRALSTPWRGMCQPRTGTLPILALDHSGISLSPCSPAIFSISICSSIIENHDHQRFICNFGTIPVNNSPNDVLLQQGNRDGKWPKVQPYIIALLTAKGTPLLAEGQEFCENYWIPDTGYGRVMVYRPVRWNYFYDRDGQPIIRLVRKLIKIRRGGAQFTDGDHFFYNDFDNFNSKGLLAFSRKLGRTFSLIAVNFTDQQQAASFVFPVSGSYTEEIEGVLNLSGVIAGVTQTISIPSNYGRIWTN
jgi:maltooligosyltrehalose trehalohydrolase